MQLSPPPASTGSPICSPRDAQGDVHSLDVELSKARIPSTLPAYSKRIPSISTSTCQYTGSPLAGPSHDFSPTGHKASSEVLNHSPVSDHSQKSGGILNGLDSQSSSSPAVSLAGSSDDRSSRHQRSKDSFDPARASVGDQDELHNVPESSSPVRPFLTLRPSSSSSASSIQTIIHINSPSSVHRTSNATAQGVFLDSESESAQVLSDIAMKASTPDDEHLGTELGPEENSPRIQFHDTVRIAGGIASKPKHEKAASKQPAERKRANRRGRRSIDHLEHGATPNSPLRYSLAHDGPSDHRSRLGSSPTVSSIGRARYDQSTSRSAAEPSSSPSSRTLPMSMPHPTKRVVHKPASARSSASHSHSRSRSSPPSSPNAHMQPRQSRLGPDTSFVRRPSLSDSFLGSGVPSTLVSRSTSPASSIYVPLRVPLVRAPAPSYGPTPGRVARVRERRRVAERDAERARGGWKALWNNWVYQSDERTARKGKTPQPPASPDGHAHAHGDAQSDSDDDSCYHDIVLEHERNKLERKLRKLARAARVADARAAQPGARAKGAARARAADGQSWLGWLWGSSPAKSGLAVVQPRLPTPGISILRNKMPPMAGAPRESGGADARTPLLSCPPDGRDYKTSDADMVGSAEDSEAGCESRFGEGPKKWLCPSWWAWKVRKVVQGWWRRVREKVVGLFYVEWKTEGRYEGWENV